LLLQKQDTGTIHPIPMLASSRAPCINLPEIERDIPVLRRLDGCLGLYYYTCFIHICCDGAAHLGGKVGGVEHPFVSGILPVLLAYVYHTTWSPADSFLSPHAFDSVWL